MPPAEPPPQDTAPGLALNAASRSPSFWWGDFVGTTITSYSLVRRAIGADPSKINYVPFKGGGEAIAAIAGGHVVAGVSGLGEFSEHIKAGRMRALAVSGADREEGIPTLKEQGVNVELGNWRGVFGGPNITTAQRDGLVKAVKAATESPQWKETLQKTGWAPWFLGGDDYKKFVDEDVKRVSAIIESLGLQKK